MPTITASVIRLRANTEMIGVFHRTSICEGVINTRKWISPIVIVGEIPATSSDPSFSDYAITMMTTKCSTRIWI